MPPPPIEASAPAIPIEVSSTTVSPSSSTSGAKLSDVIETLASMALQPEPATPSPTQRPAIELLLDDIDFHFEVEPDSSEPFEDVPETAEERAKHSSLEEMLQRHGMAVPQLPDAISWQAQFAATGASLFVSSEEDGTISEIDDLAVLHLADESAFWSMSED